MSKGAFSAASREAIYTLGEHRCIGCGSAQITAQHRHARGMGGTRSAVIASPANGVPLCGDGVSGCHGWAESYPNYARLLGWRLEVGQDPEGAPFWTRFGWRAWVLDEDTWLVSLLDEDDLDHLTERRDAVDEVRTVIERRRMGVRHG